MRYSGSANKGFSAIAIIVVGLVLAGAGAGYLFVSRGKVTDTKSADTQVELEETEKVTKTTTETGKGESPFGRISITSEVTTTEECDDDGCFSEKFAACSPASLSANSPLGSVYYEILGPKEGGCEVKIKYTQNPNPEWVNKEMACIMDSSIAFQESIEKTFNEVISGELTCEGPLFSVLSNL